MKPIPKSLHTVTVLVNVAEYCRCDGGGRMSVSDAVEFAASILGLNGRPDRYGLIESAIKQLSKKRNQI